MTTKPKLDSKPPAGITIELAEEMWDHLGRGYPALVELVVVERTEPAEAEDDRSVKLRITSCEIAPDDETATAMRQQLRGMYDTRRAKERELARAMNGELPLDTEAVMDEVERRVNAGDLDLPDGTTVTMRRQKAAAPA